ncbi:hypothetical protein [Streptomyces sp. FH025]|uniref:hypothetical protein n=1 Tax=Streptomyces sp. FH025 TaxID=2815937 RepID=UPI001A9E6C54|nr:hypothetical protein [Streptomyces sp. FH025]MBO1418162.1 hypothetical protein [Streptomyces sp. FH025]
MRKTAVRAAVIALVVAAAAAAGLWWLLGRDDPDRDCAGLRGDARIRTVLGGTWRADLPCRDLADGLRRAATGDRLGDHPDDHPGDRPGVHTVEQARAMRTVVLALADSPEHRVHPEVRRPLAQALADYAVDTHAVLTGVDNRYQSHAGPNDDAWQDDRGAHFAVPEADLVRALRGLAEDPTAYGLLRAADLRQGAAALAAVRPDATDATNAANAAENAILDPLVQAAAPAGAFDGIADDVLRERGDAAGRSWRTEALTALSTSAGPQAAKAAKPEPVPDFAADPAGHLTAGWLATLTPADPDGASGWARLHDQAPALLAAWAEAAHADLTPQALRDCQDRARTTTAREQGDTATALKALKG